MNFPDLTICTEKKKKRRRVPDKTRQFRVTSLAYVTADSLWELGYSAKTTRPVWIAYVAPDQAARAFTANFRAGRKAAHDRGTRVSDVFEIPKKAPHRWTWHRHDETTVTVAYIPELFHLEPAVPPTDITFLFMPPHWWLNSQARALEPDFGEDARETARAAYFVAYLDRRSPLPIVHDLGFHLQLYRAALEQPWIREANTDARLRAQRVPFCGLDLPLLCHTSHQDFEAFLADQTNLYFEKEIRRGQNRLHTDCRVLPFPHRAATQLCLDFAVA